MNLRMAVLLMLIALAGCRSGAKSPFVERLTKNKPRPESNVPPRRLVADSEGPSEPEGRASTKMADDSDISLTEFSPSSGDNGEAIELSGATIVARVNSVPIFAEDVLEPWAPQIERAAQELTPEELNRLRAKLIRTSLARHIEKAVLVSAMRESLKRDELQKLNDQLDKLWTEHELESLRQKLNCGTTVELERKLEEQGTTLANYKHAFATREMAMFYMGQQSQKQAPKLGPKELRAWYDEHQEQFKIIPKARWQQIHVKYTKGPGLDEAKAKLNEAVNDLKNGADFGDVVKAHSDGPNAAEGGIWDWTNEGSVANKKINKALFELPVGRISSPIDTGEALVLVKVLERQEGGIRPFEEVQSEITQRLQNEGRKETAERIIRELTETATVWTIFDKS